MIAKIFKEHVPEWIEAGSIIGTILIAGIAAAAIALYKIDLVQNDISEIKTNMAIVPILATNVENMNNRLENVEDDVDVIQEKVGEIQVENAKHHTGHNHTD